MKDNIDNICVWFTRPEALKVLQALAMAGRLAKREEDQERFFRIYDFLDRVVKMQAARLTMLRDIDANEFKKKMECYPPEERELALEALKSIKTADVRENVHAKWIKHEDRACWYCLHCNTDDYYAYSWNCSTGEYELQDRFCPNCGAVMDEKEDET